MSQYLNEIKLVTSDGQHKTLILLPQSRQVNIRTLKYDGPNPEEAKVIGVESELNELKDYLIETTGAVDADSDAPILTTLAMIYQSGMQTTLQFDMRVAHEMNTKADFNLRLLDRSLSLVSVPNFRASDSCVAFQDYGLQPASKRARPQ